MRGVMTNCRHETLRFSVVDRPGTGSDPLQGDGRAPRGTFQDRGGQDFRNQPSGRSRVDCPPEKIRGARPSSQATGAAGGRAADGAAGEDDCPAHHRPLPRSVEAAVLSVDARSGGTVDGPAVWGAAFGLDGGAAAGALGVHPAEARTAGFRAGFSSRSVLVGATVSGDSRVGSPRKSDGFLGRRDGLARRSCRRSEFQSPGPDAGDSGHGPAVSLQSDFGHHQPGASAIHGLQEPLYRGGLFEIHRAAAAPEPAAENFPDSRRASSSSGQSHGSLAQTPSGGAARLFPARLQSRTQSRRIPQPGCQGQRGGPHPAARPHRIDWQRSGVSAIHPSPSPYGQTLFSGTTCPLCFTVNYFTLRVINLYAFVGNGAGNRVDSLGLSHRLGGLAGGKCCNKTSNDEWWIDDGVWKKLPPGK